jgi:acyl-CoA synthetase (NDP forming)
MLPSNIDCSNSSWLGGFDTVEAVRCFFESLRKFALTSHNQSLEKVVAAAEAAHAKHDEQQQQQSAGQTSTSTSTSTTTTSATTAPSTATTTTTTSAVSTAMNTDDDQPMSSFINAREKIQLLNKMLVRAPLFLRIHSLVCSQSDVT